MSDQHNREYGILEIQDSRLRFRYNLNSLRTEEKEIWLSAIYVDDGQWHTAKVSRYGSAAILTLDGGEGRRYNDTFVFKGHQVRSAGSFNPGVTFQTPLISSIPAQRLAIPT